MHARLLVENYKHLFALKPWLSYWIQHEVRMHKTISEQCEMSCKKGKHRMLQTGLDSCASSSNPMLQQSSCGGLF